MYFLAASKPYDWRHAVLPWEGNPVSGTERVLVAFSDVDNGEPEDCGVLRSTSQFGYSPVIKLYVLDPGCSSNLSWLQPCGWRVLSFLQLQQQNRLCLGLAYPLSLISSLHQLANLEQRCDPAAPLLGQNWALPLKWHSLSSLGGGLPLWAAWGQLRCSL